MSFTLLNSLLILAIWKILINQETGNEDIYLIDVRITHWHIGNPVCAWR